MLCVCVYMHPPHSSPCTALCVFSACLNQNVRVQDSRAGFSGSVSIPSITKNRAEPGRSMSASSGLGIREYSRVRAHVQGGSSVCGFMFAASSRPCRLVLAERQRSAPGAVRRKLRVQTPDHDLSLRELPVLRRRGGLR